MKKLIQSILVILVIAITIGAAVLQGQKSYRWGTNRELVLLGEALQEFPAEVGDWSQIDEVDLSYDAQRQLGCFASFVRFYQHNQTGETIQLALLLGPTGPTSVHTPDICYNSVEYKVHENRARITLETDDFTDSFWSIYFQSKDVDGGYLRSVYGWSGDGNWQSPDSSRFAFAGKPYLFKLQIASSGDSSTAIENDDSIERFLDQFTSIFRKRIRQSSNENTGRLR